MADDSAPHTDRSGSAREEVSTEDASAGASGPSVLRRIGRAVAAVLGVVGLLLGGVVLFLQTETGATTTARYLAEEFNPLPGTELSVERASGSWIGSIRLVGVTLSRVDSASGERLEMAAVDTLSARYELLPLLQSRLHVRRARVAGPSVTLRQEADSTWDWSRILPASEEDTSASAFTVRLDRMAVQRGAVTAAFYTAPPSAPNGASGPSSRDSIAQVRDLTVAASGIRVSDAVSARLDTLALRARAPGDTSEIRFSAKGRLSPTTVGLDTLLLASPRSRVHGGGRARLPEGPGDTLDDVDLTLTADPLSFRDLNTLLPTLGLDPQEAVRLDARVSGSDRMLHAVADAQFTGGGTASARASVTPRTELPASAPDTSRLRYRLDASVTDLTTSLVAAPDSATNRVSADLFADLRGPALDRLDGPVRARLLSTRAYGLRTDSLGLDARLRGGESTFRLAGDLNDARIDADGRARLLDAEPTYRFRARLRRLNVDAFAPGSGIDTQIGATVTAEGRTFGGPDAVLDLNVDLQRSRIEEQVVDAGTAALRLRPDSATFDADVAFPEGRVRALGRADLRGSERFVVDTARVENLDVAALTGDTTSSAVNGRFRARGRGFSPETMTLDAQLDLADSHYSTVRLSQVKGTARLNRGRMTAAVEAVVNGSSWEMSAESRPFASPLTARVTDGRFRSLDLGAFASEPAQDTTDAPTDPRLAVVDTTGTSDLNGTFSASLTGTDPASMTATAALTLDRSRLNQQTISGGSFEAQIESGLMNADVSVDLPEGSGQGKAIARPFADTPTYRVTDARFENVDAGALAGIEGLTTALTGRIEAEGRGFDPESIQFRSDLQLEPSPVNRAVASGGRLRVSADTGRASVDGSLQFADGGRLRLSGSAGGSDSLTYDLRLSAGRLDAGALAGLDSATTVRADTLAWTLDGTGTDLSTLTAQTRFATGRIQVDRFLVRGGQLAGRIDSGTLELDTLDLQSNAVNAAGSGRIALADTASRSNFKLLVGVTDARPLRRLLGAEKLSVNRARAVVNVYGPPGVLRFDGETEIRRLVYDDIRAADFKVQFNGAGSVAGGLDQGDLRGELGFFSSSALTAENTQLDVSYDSTELNLRTRIRLDRQRTASLDARVNPLRGQQRFRIADLSMRLGPDQWRLLQPSTVSYEDAYRINTLLLYSGNQQIAADGVVDFNGMQNLVVTVEQFRLGSVTDLFGFSGLGGRLSGTVDLTGPATAPKLNAQLNADVESENERIGALDVGVQYDSLTASVDARLDHVSGQELTARGSIPTDLRLATPPGAPDGADLGDRPISIAIATDAFPVGWVDPFLDPATVRDVTGTLQAGIDVRGTLDDPDLDGEASVRDAGAFVPGLSVAYSRGSADVTFDGDRARVESASIRTTNGGRLRADGTVDFSALTLGEFDLSVTANNFIGIDDRAYSNAVLDGSFTLRGTTERPVLTGTAEIQQADVFFTEATAASESDYATVRLSEDDQLALEERFGLRISAADTTTFDAYQAMEMDLSVLIRGDTWLRSDGTPELDVQFRGDLDLEKAAGEDAQVFGTIQVVTRRSTIRQFGREFDITEGTLTFNGDPTMPYLDLAARYEPRVQGSTNETSVTITLSLEGRPDEISPTLESDPPMDTRNILSYLATGKPADEILSGGGGGSLTESVPLGVAASFAENFAANRLGLDVVRFKYRSGGEWYLTVGQYLTPRFYVAIEQSVGAGIADRSALELVPDLTLEYQLTSYMQLRTVRRQSSLRFNVFLEYAY